MLRALCRYYDNLRRRPNCGLPPDGYSKVTVNYNLTLTKDGEIKDIIPYVREIMSGGKIKTEGRKELFPFRNSSTSIAAEVIDHREKYIFGIVYDKRNGGLTVDSKSLEAFEKCAEKNMDFLSDVRDEVAEAYKNFMRKWDPRENISNPILLKMGKDYNGAKFVITTEDNETKPLNAAAGVTAKWNETIKKREEDPLAERGQCAVTGKIEEIARTHDNILGIRGAQTSGASLVCFNNTAFESYGKKQSYNSGVSVEAMKKYTAALNYLVSEETHKQELGDMTLVFWADTDTDETPYLSGFWYGMFPSAEMAEDKELKSVFERMARGETSDIEGMDMSVDFCVIGLKPNSSRLSVKLFEKNSFGAMMKNIISHCEDMRFSSDDDMISVWQIDRELKSPNVTDGGDASLQSKLLMSVLKGSPYPRYMLETVVRRCRTDHDNSTKKFYSVNKRRVRIIRACLIRDKYIEKGGYSMLQENSTDTAYLLGRLFAVLEKTQRDALGDINSSIKDKYFSSACATPYLVFPRLLKLFQTHIAKLDEGNRIYRDRLVQEILSKLDGGFPRTYGTEEQGMFILGYYQQKQKFYEKINKGEE